MGFCQGGVLSVGFCQGGVLSWIRRMFKCSCVKHFQRLFFYTLVFA